MRHTLTWFTVEDDGYPRAPEVVMPSAFEEGSDLLWEWLDTHAIPVFVWLHYTGELMERPAMAYWAGVDDGFFFADGGNRKVREEDIAKWAYYPTRDNQTAGAMGIDTEQLGIITGTLMAYDRSRSSASKAEYAAQIAGMLKLALRVGGTEVTAE